MKHITMVWVVAALLVHCSYCSGSSLGKVFKDLVASRDIIAAINAEAAAAAATTSPDAIVVDVGFSKGQTLLPSSDFWNRHPENGLSFNIKSTLDATMRMNAKEVAYACSVTAIPNAATMAYHITSLAPYTKATARGVTLVHHMDIFFCDASVLGRPITNRECVNYEGEQGCHPLSWAYDKGALEPYDLPKDAGFLVGRGTPGPFAAIAVQIHYLMPRSESSAQLLQENFRDISGVRLSLTPHLREQNAGTFSFIGGGMAIPPKTRGLRYVAHLPAAVLHTYCAHDFEAAPGGVLHIRDVHMHAHSHAEKLVFAITRGPRGGEHSATTLGSVEPEHILTLEPYCGEGVCQHFQRVPQTALSELRDGDALSLICYFRNPEQYTLSYGVGYNEEMCGAIVIFTPHTDAHHVVVVPQWRRSNAKVVEEEEPEQFEPADKEEDATSFWDTSPTQQRKGGVESVVSGAPDHLLFPNRYDDRRR